MKSKELRIICVGKIKTSYWKEAADHYLSLARKMRPITSLEVRDASSTLSAEARALQESQHILQQVTGKDLLIAMHEKGTSMTSREFAAFLRSLDEKEQRRINFIIGGPFGLSAPLLEKCTCKMSLSAMTWPHELARVLLLEQIFRAESILRNYPYHH